MSRIPNLLSLPIRNTRCVYTLLKAKHSPVCQSPQFALRTIPQITNTRSICTQSVKFSAAKQPISGVVNTTEWQTVYRFPLIVHVRLFSRSKLYLTLITVIGVPNAAVFYYNGVLAFEEMLGFCAVSGFSTALLYAFGHLFRRLIGSIYISPDQNLVRMSHLTFFGNRQETVLQLNDIAPLCDSNHNMKDIFLRVTSSDPSLDTMKDSLFLSLKFGGIVDRDKFMQIFGSI